MTVPIALQLTWRNRLSRVPTEKVYNFFSSTEEVLHEYADDDLVWDGAGTVLKKYSWVKQEKFKGRRDRIGDVPQMGMDIGGASSNYGGWSFNDEYSKFSLLPPYFSRHFTPEEAALEIGEGVLATAPFFALDVWHLFSDPNSILEPNLDNLVSIVAGVTPSDFVLKPVAETGLKDYYDDNAPAHNQVLVRDWLLAEALPATTLPMGANRNPVLTIRSQNIDMSGVLDNNGGCCKTNEDMWPRRTANGALEWWHGDYKDVPYQHAFGFYKRIFNLVNN